MAKLNNPVKVETEFGGRKLTIETGRFAKQAHGSVYISYGETSALVTAVGAKQPKEGIDFFPLTIEFQEKFYASGKIPGGFFRREAKPSDWATLNARMVDRPLRPLFPEGYRNETQVVVTLTSYDNENEAECIAGVGASAALLISDIPFDNPIATVRVGRLDAKFVVNPTPIQQESSDVNILVSATKDAIVMVEGGADFVSEEIFLDALFFGFEQAQHLIALQEKLQKIAGKTKRPLVLAPKEDALIEDVRKIALPQLEKAYSIKEKQQRYEALDATKKAVLEAFKGKAPEGVEAAAFDKKVDKALSEVKKDYARQYTMTKSVRIDGRKYTDVRTIETEVNVLPRVHGSSLFTRGETQALAIVTLGTGEDEQLIDSVRGKFNKRVMLHYNFPPYCVGEVGRFGGNSRREVGHGMLAERAISSVIPNPETFQYTIRIVSEVLESNGSSSMATVCSSSMALMQAGVPVKNAVAGIAMGLMSEGDNVVVLSDILGDEDHLGDMDFKICGSKDGICAVQMDMKVKGLTKEVLRKALLQARDGRLHILGEMEKTITEASKEVSKFAPRFTTLKISTERIKDLIGPGGKNIKGIVAQTGVKIDIDDDGTVHVSSVDPEATEKALELIANLTAEPEVGKVYMGTVVKIVEFGAFVNIMPGCDGLLHISEIDNNRINRVTDVLQDGDQVPVKVLEIDRSGKIRLSRRAALASAQGEQVQQ
ncbi:MAG: polyribonucleotide nucleotidyltransferase [Proteobacteria bacterium]|nr:polyribonucleotide nucleotidyltransferase [Pseudomonadota bacterium]